VRLICISRIWKVLEKEREREGLVLLPDEVMIMSPVEAGLCLT
jgi:hypothetical protein